MILWRRLCACSSDVILGVFLVFAYAGDSNAFTADLPESHNTALERRVCGGIAGEEAHPTFEVVNSLAIQDPNPVLEPRFTTAEKVHDISDFLRCLLLLFGG